jgi:hypothetical protein
VAEGAGVVGRLVGAADVVVGLMVEGQEQLAAEPP